MDYVISWIVNKVWDLGIENNIIIIFISDNGGDVDYVGDNVFYKGEKGDLIEGGINVLVIWYYKGIVSFRVILILV